MPRRSRRGRPRRSPRRAQVASQPLFSVAARGAASLVRGTPRVKRPGRSLLPAEAKLKARPHVRPVVVDNRVPRRVAPLAAAYQHVLAEHAFELGRKGGESCPRALVRRVRLELDPEVALVL